jgi:hypothetical protein
MTSRFKKSSSSGYDVKKFHIAQMKESEAIDGGVLIKGLWGDTSLSLEESSDPPQSDSCKALWDFYVGKDGVRFRLTQLWECESKGGNTYFSGFLSKSKLTLLASLGGEEDTWDLFLEEGKKEAEEQEAMRVRAAEEAQRPASSSSQKPNFASDLDDAVPF